MKVSDRAKETAVMEFETKTQRLEAAPPAEMWRRATVVIADTGATAQVIVVESDAPLAVGSCFSHGGSRWKVVGRRRDSRVMVAQPAAP